jgi:predicted RNase H-like HicB family nuclease
MQSPRLLKNLLVQKKVANRQMIKKKYIYWQDDDMWLGYLEEYPDYWTQGETEQELRENLLDIYNELTSGTIQNIRRVAELEVS